MARFIVKRIARGLVTLFIFQTVLFFAIQLLLPGDFVTQFVLNLSRAERLALRTDLGLNVSIWDQYTAWVGRVIMLDFGHSFNGRPVVDFIRAGLPPTLLVFVSGTLLAFFIGLWLGKFTGWNKPNVLTWISTFSAITFYTSFPPGLAFMVVYFFGFRLGWFRRILTASPFGSLPRAHWFDVAVRPDPGTIILLMFATVIGIGVFLSLIINRILWRRYKRRLSFPLYIVSLIILSILGWNAIGIDVLARDMLELAAMPIITYTLLSFGETMLIMRTSMADTLNEEYITTARAKGLSDATIRDKHAARNALLPVLSRLVMMLPFLLTGTVIIEQAMRWPGMGSSLVQAVNTQDVPVAIGMLLFVGVISLIARIIIDVMQVYFDPRIRYKAHP